MGNQLVAFAPSIIRPIEYYLTDVPELIFDSNLGSTRFLKVCRARQEGLLFVVKVFVIHEHTLPIHVYCERLVNLRNSLSSSPSPNCLAFTKVKMTEKCVIVIRPYIKYSLYDRMSTRPFILWSEKLWIAFQLLCGLVQVHKHGLCHGDLKLENILITPGLRLLLCDFAPFKPVYLPRNNPSSIFGFFFDTAGRRCCYVAPERFHDDKSKLGLGADNLLTQEDELKHFLLPSMDIFSAGCCLIELFTEGVVPFDLSQLLSYCAGEYDPSPVISEKIENEVARELVTHMIQIDPTKRLTAEEYLTNYREKLFPEIFYTSLQSYYDILAFQPLLKPDARMARLHHDRETLPDDPSVSLIIISLITAEIRGLGTTTGKLYALESLEYYSTKINDEAILERVVPYIDYLLHDQSSHRVRAQALQVLVDCLDLVTQVPPSEYNIFSGYIFPSLEKLDKDLAVRISMARNIARLAQISSRYLETSFIKDADGIPQQQIQHIAELQSQKDIIGSFLNGLLTDPDPIVKRVLVSTPGSLEILCTYFGRSKANDVLLSHLITFLNDKDDAQLRIAFFKCVPAVATFIGWQAAPLLIPLLKQGLADVEDFVVRDSLLTIQSLTEINFFGTRFLLDLLDEAILFLIHPNLWLRNAAAGVISSIKKNLSEIDVHCHIIPKLKDYLKSSSSNSIWDVNEVSILSKVKPPLERQVYESCARAKSALLNSAIQFFQNNEGQYGAKPDTMEVSNFITRLRAEGLPQPLDPIYTSFINRHVQKVNTNRSLRQTGPASQSAPIPIPIDPGSINSSTVQISSNRGAVTYSASLSTQQSAQSNLVSLTTPPIKDINYYSTSGGSTAGGGNGPTTTQGASTIGQSSGHGLSESESSCFSSSSGMGNSYPERFVDKPRGILVAHLHEHRNSILKILPLTVYNGVFASCSRENVRIWDAEKMEGRNVANRSRCIIKLPNDSVLTSIAYASGNNLLGVTDDKYIYGYQIEQMVAKPAFTFPFNTGHKEDVGIPITLESCSNNLFIVGTELGSLLGFDTRTGTREAFRLQSDLASGLLTTLTSDPDQLWMCTGSSKGILTCWDIRFNIPVNKIKTDSPIRRVKLSPFHPWGVFTCSRSQNEVSLWNMETGSRHLCFWSSPQPPLTKPQMERPGSQNPQSQIHSTLGLAFVKKYNAVVTGGTDMTIRWWDMSSPNDSFVLMSPEKAEQQISGNGRNTGEFRVRLVEGVEVIHDISSSMSGINSRAVPSGGGSNSPSQSSSTTSSSCNSSSGTTAHSTVMGNSHHNTITDVTTVTTPNQSFILSTSSDGVIKVWK